MLSLESMNGVAMTPALLLTRKTNHSDNFMQFEYLFHTKNGLIFNK